MIKILFFDVGSTLVDETLCYQERFLHFAKQTNLSLEEVEKEIIDLIQLNQEAEKVFAEKHHCEVSFWNSEKERLYDDVIPFLEKWSKTYLLGIIANQSYGLEDRLQKWNIRKYFSYIISSSDVQIKKPDKQIFLEALKKASIKANEAFMIGDRLDHDIFPASSLGMKTIWVKTGIGQYGSLSSGKTVDGIANHFGEIDEILSNFKDEQS
jgi:putative hydrolase of the HAD superfamily